MTKPQDDYIKTALRLPPDLHAEIKSAAEYHGRSMNAEILARLTATPAGPATLDTLAEQQQRTQAMVQQIIDALTPRR
jgi:hypothetical protein